MRGTDVAKRELRRTLGPLRRQAALAPGGSAASVERLRSMPELAAPRTVMSFTPMPGEPDLTALSEILAARGATVVTPAADRAAPWPIAPDAVDVVLVPGLAFTRRGDRLGHGGGWYDRFLAAVRSDCVIIGVCFDAQVVDHLPVAPHDVRVHVLVTPSGRWVATR